MTAKEGLEFLEQVLAPESLNKIQQTVFEQAWEGRSYKEIADESGYTLGYIKDTGSELWQLLSEALGQRVTRRNFQTILKRSIQLGKQEQKIGTSEAIQNPEAKIQNRVDWGEAIDVSIFYNRTNELAQLVQWVQHDRCHVVTILGMGGMGKTALSVKLGEQVKDEFDYLIWRSLRHAPSLQELLADLISVLSDQAVMKLPEAADAQISCLMKYLRQQRCLLILDNVEAIFQSGQHTGRYRQGYEAYSRLLERVSDERHQSCLVLTSRERPAEVSLREGDTLPVRSLQLVGLSTFEGQKILTEKGLLESDADCHQLVEHYSGNPLALKIAAATIRSLFHGKIETFLTQGSIVFGDISELLDQQLNRLSDLEQQVMYWLAICREWVSLESLQEDIVPQATPRNVLEAVASLQARSLIETNAVGFSQQPVVMEYMTEQLVKRFYYDLSTHAWIFFDRYALIKAQAKDYIREAQIRLILQPVKEKLLAAFGNQQNLKNHLHHLLAAVRVKPIDGGYAAGNLLNLFWQLHSDLNDCNFSNLTIRQAYLPNVSLHRANFSHCKMAQSVFAETFGGVACVAFSPDGKRLATSDTSGAIQLWDIPSGRQLVICKGHKHWTWAVAFSPNGQFLVSASDDYLVKLWDVHTGDCLKTFVGHTYSVNAIAVSSDGQHIATSSQDATIRLWHLQAPGDLAQAIAYKSRLGVVSDCLQLLGHQGRVWSVVFSPDGQTLASCSEDQTIKLWDWRTGQCMKTLTGHQGWVKALAYSPDGKHLASGSFDHTVKIWDRETGDCLKTLSGHTSTITTVTYSPDGQCLASSSYDQTLKLWEAETGQCTRTLHGHGNRVWSVAFSPTRQWLASGGDDHAAKLWDVKTGQCIKTIKGHTNAVLALALSSDGHHLASGYEDQTIRLWDTVTEACVQTLHGHRDRVWSVAFNPQASDDGSCADELTLASGSADRTIKLWHWQTGHCLNTLEGHSSWVWAMAFHPQRPLLASGSYDRTVKLWDLDAGKCVQTLEEHTAPVISVAFSPNGAWLASSSFDTTIKLWDVQTGQCLQTLLGHSNSVWQVRFSADGQSLVSCSFDQTIKRWDVSTGKCLQTLEGHTEPVMTVTYDSDEQHLISGGLDQTVRYWEVATGKCIQVLKGHTGLVSTMVCQPIALARDTGNQVGTDSPETVLPQATASLFSGSFDETIKRWSLETRSCTSTLRVPRPYEGMNISQTLGLNEAQRITLRALGAVSDKR
ncbi:NACHT domain-containing protein [Leptolyngbya sp. FACHB-321]|nr:NACHT domain-containing protein [Leptolyngbya sp. FACHB-321]